MVRATAPADASLPALPADDEGPVFREPWEAQAFALVLDLYDRGHFDWPEWVELLSAEIAAAEARGEVDRGERYYLHWLAALEKLVAAKGWSSAEAIARRKAEWAQADAERGFGEPPVLRRGSSER